MHCPTEVSVALKVDPQVSGVTVRGKLEQGLE